jgi:GNAT superfamily N-acetyltransferase
MAFGHTRTNYRFSKGLPPDFMDIRIRSGCKRDQPKLIALLALAIKSFYTGSYTPLQMAAVIESQVEDFGKNGELLFVAEVSGSIVGFAALASSGCDIEAVYVHPDWMLKGIGKKLVAALEEVASKRGCHWLKVVSTSQAAAFYKSQGYWTQEHFDYRASSSLHQYRKTSVPCQMMQKSLLSSHSVGKKQKPTLMAFFRFS